MEGRIVADNTIQIEIELDGKKGFATLNKDLIKAGEDGGQEFGDSFKKRVAEVFSGQALEDTAKELLNKFKELFSEAISEAVNQENAINALNQALSNTGRYTEAASKSFQSFAEEMQKNTKFADDAILNTGALIQNLGNLTPQSLERATKAAVELSTALGIDLNSAAVLVGKAANGNVAAFARYGLQVQKAKDNAVSFENALHAIETRFNGSAEAATKTFGGALAQTKNSFDDVLKQLGAMLTQSPQVVALLNGLSVAFTKIADSLKGVVAGNSLGPLINDLVKVAVIFNDLLTPPLLKFGQIFDVVFQSVRTALFGALEAFGELGFKIDEVLNKVGLVSDDQIAKNKELIGKLTEQTQNGADALAAAIGDMTYGSIQPTVDFLDGLFNGIADTVGSASEKIAGFAASGKGALEDLSMKGKISADNLNKAFNSSLASGISSGVQSFTKALIAGKNAFQAFGQAVLGIVGDMAIQLGTFFIAQGIAQLALASNPLTAGGAIIAAGAGLVALGVLLKSLSGGGSSANAGADAAAGAGGGVASGADSAATQQQENQAVKPSTQVAINVQGNILDRRESGLEIAQVIQDFFDTQDGVIAKA